MGSKFSLISAGCFIAIAFAAMGYVGALYQFRETGPENLAAPADFCGEAPNEICQLKYANYKKAWQLGERLAKRNCLIASAESMTVGKFAGTFGAVKWAGQVLAGGVTTYNTSVKNALLAVAETTDRGVISKAVALEMVAGLQNLFKPVNIWQKKRAQDKKVCLYIAFTGAATQWGDIQPRVHIALAEEGSAAEVHTFELRRDLSEPNLARRFNIQLAIWHGLGLIEKRINTS